MRPTLKDLEGKSVEELKKFALNFLKEDTEETIRKKFVIGYYEPLINAYNKCIANFRKDNQEDKCIATLKNILTNIIKNLENYDKFYNCAKEAHAQFVKYENEKGYEKVEEIEADFNKRVINLANNGINPDEINETINEIQQLRKNFDNEIKKANLFVELEEEIKQILEELKNEEFDRKKYNVYENKLSEISRSFNKSINNDAEINKIMKQMGDLKNSLSNELKKSHNLKREKEQQDLHKENAEIHGDGAVNLQGNNIKDETINDIKPRKDTDENFEELEKQFEASKNKVDEKLKELKDSKKLKEKTYDTYKRKVDYISKIYDGNSEFKIKTAIARMNDLDNILKGELNKYSSEFKSLEELKEEKLEENETKESKVKNYIKAKIGNARYLEAEVVKYSEWYKGKNEFIPLGEMREIYGTKGALMMICRLEDGSVKNKKRFSAYRRFCKKILENYRSLKVEAAIAALEGDEISASSFKEEDAKELNSMLHELNNLMGKDTSKFPLANPKDKKFNLSKFFSSTKSQIAKLKNTKGEKNKKHKELIDKVIKEIRKIESQSPSDSFNIDASMEREEYIKKYDNFVSESAELAVTYLKTEGKIKIQRFASQGKKKVLFEFKIFNKERDLAMDACKVALMCLVAVCSKDKKHITEGKKYFRNVKKYLNKYIG